MCFNTLQVTVTLLPSRLTCPAASWPRHAAVSQPWHCSGSQNCTPTPTQTLFILFSKQLQLRYPCFRAAWHPDTAERALTESLWYPTPWEHSSAQLPHPAALGSHSPHWNPLQIECWKSNCLLSKSFHLVMKDVTFLFGVISKHEVKCRSTPVLTWYCHRLCASNISALFWMSC